MKVLVTGGNGFVGSHSVRALVNDGHEVRLLVRDRARAESALDRLGVAVSGLVVGDITDAGAVTEAIQDCGGVLHTAAVYSFAPRDVHKITASNVEGTQVVLEAAVAAGCDPIVHVSSYTALLPQHEQLTPDTAPGAPATPYARSKAEADRVARSWQAGGAPVVISYPGLVVGPNDPNLGESNRLIQAMLSGHMPFELHGVFPIADVRYVAAAHAAMMQRGHGARRYLVSGLDTPAEELRQGLRTLTQRRLPAFPAPHALVSKIGKMADMLQRTFPVRLPVGYEGPYILASTPAAGTDSSRTESDLGITPPPLDRTLHDTVAWMVQAGHLPHTAAGSLSTNLMEQSGSAPTA